MRKDDLRRTIMEILNRTEMHGYEISKQLTLKGMRMHLSYLYRVLTEMEKNGYLKSSIVGSKHGPEKKVYKLHEKGREMLDLTLREAVRIIHVRYMDYIAKLPPQKSIVRKLQSLLNLQVGNDEKVLVVAPKVFYDWMVIPLCKKLDKGTVYLIKPKSTKLDVEPENLLVLDTVPRNILLKDNFIDSVRVHGEPDDFQEALNEFHRVSKKDGSLALVIPYFHLHKDDYPLTFAEFVEKVEHEISKEDKAQPGSESIRALVSRCFRKVKCYRIAHLSVFVAKGKT